MLEWSAGGQRYGCSYLATSYGLTAVAIISCPLAERLGCSLLCGPLRLGPMYALAALAVLSSCLAVPQQRSQHAGRAGHRVMAWPAWPA